MRAFRCLALIVALSISGAAPGRAEDPPACPLTFRFEAPNDWRCSDESTPACTVCRNRSLRYSDLLVGCAEARDPERRHLPPGATVKLCQGRAS